MAEPVTLVTFLLDKSGSMESIRDDTIGAFNTYLDTLRTSKANIDFSFLQFDSNSVDKVCVNKPIADVPLLDRKTFVPGASTPLIDAAYNTIKAVETVLTKSDTTPKVVVCIQTDGQENSSVEHTWDDLNALIKEKTALGWQFNFMGAGIDAYQQGMKMGIAVGQTVSYDSSDRRATMRGFAATARNTAMYASGLSGNTQYTVNQKHDSGDKFVDALTNAHSQAASQPKTVKPHAKKTLVKPIVDRIDL